MNILQIAIDKILPTENLTAAVNDSTSFLENMADSLGPLKGKTGMEIVSILGEHFITFGLKVLAALAIYAVGAWIIKKTKKLLKRVFVKKNTDPSLAGFILSLVNVVMVVLMIVIVVSTLGINTTSFAAILASGGLAIGMAMSGTLQNFAGGIMILAFKPFGVGDYIAAGGYEGTVHSITITSTKLHTIDGKLVIIPNGTLSNSSVDNFTAIGTRRVEWKVSISYGDDFEKAKQAILELFAEDSRIIIKDKPVVCYLNKMNESSVDLVVRAYVSSDLCWDVYYEYNEKIYTYLPNKGLHFPFPHIVVKHD
ncbi:MAG: mechanosensitive ion channel [Bacteroidales bacterium]|nr:mechanosensitive ion channel [Bacteroidales bacterium]